MISLGTLKSFNSTDYRAEVQMAGSITAYLDNIPVARNIASSQMVTGRHVIVAIPEGNPKDACVIAVWAGAAGGGGGGGASNFLALTDTPGSYSGQAGKYPKVNAAQNALEFGQTLDDHHARHEWLGADEMAIKLSMLSESYFHTSWEPDITWSTFTSGSGSVGAASFLDRRIATGATINSEAGLYIAVTASICPQRDGRPVMFFGGHTQPETDSRVRVYYDDGAATPPSNTGKHIGWEVLNGDLYATHCNGVNAEVKTDTGIHMVRYSYKKLVIKGDATHSWFYVNGVLKATHTTNLAGYYNGRIWIGIKNTAAVNKQWKLASMNFGYGS